MSTTLDAVLQARDNHQTIRGRYLQEHGWEYECDLPGSFWLWQKKIDGRLLALEASSAIQIEEALDRRKGD